MIQGKSRHANPQKRLRNRYRSDSDSKKTDSTASVLERATAIAFLAQNKRVSKLTHLPVGRTPKRSRVSATEAGSLVVRLLR